MAKVKSSKSKSKVVKHTLSIVEQDLAASLAALKKVPVSESLLVYKERAMNSVIKLNDRIKAKTAQTIRAAEREAKKADRNKAKADRAAKTVERKKAKVAKIREQIAKLEVQAAELD